MEENKDWQLKVFAAPDSETGAGILLSQHRFEFKAIEQECAITGEPIEDYFKRLSEKAFNAYLHWKNPHEYDDVEFFAG